MDDAEILKSCLAAPDGTLTGAPEPPEPLWRPDPAQISGSQLTAFMRHCERATGQHFATYAAFDAFSVADSARFWTLLLEWSALLVAGDASPALTSAHVEHARFFPELRLNYTQNLLRLDGVGTAAERPALTVIGSEGTVTRWTRGEIHARVTALSAAIAAQGIGIGDRIALIACNGADAVCMALAAAALGCTVSTLAPELGTAALLSRLTRIEPALVLVDLAALPVQQARQQIVRIGEALTQLPALRMVVLSEHQEAPPGLAVLPVQLEALVAAGAGHAVVWPDLPFDHPLFVLFSSGTTGPPKCIVHGAGGTLLEHVKEHRLHCDLRPDDRLFFRTSPGWMMWNWQLSALAGGTEIVLQDGPITAAQQLWRLVSELQVTVFGTSPGYLQLCEESPGPVSAGLDFGALRGVLSTGSILSPRQQEWLWQTVKPLPIQSISGGTDIIGCFVLGNPNLPVYSAEAQCRSLGLDVRSLGQDAPGQLGIGELVCANPFPSRPVGFLHDPDGQAFHKAYFSQTAGFWTHGDRIAISPAGSVRLCGRSDGVLNVRGIRIGPAEIYRILDGIPEIAEAMAVEQAWAGDIGGSRLVLLVVLKPDQPLDEALRGRIRRTLATQASAAHVPSVMLAVAELPTTHSGKRSETSARDALNGKDASNLEALRNPDSLLPLREFAQTAAAGTATVAAVSMPPHTEPSVELVAGALAQVIGQTGIAENENFFDLGIDSLAALQLASELERRTGQSVPLTALVQAPTVRDLTELLTAGKPVQSSLLVTLKEGAGRPLFVVHGYGGMVVELRPLAQRLETDAVVHGIRASGFEPGEPVYTRIEEMSAAYLDAIRDIQPEGPYQLAGYSMGGLIAFDIARRLSEGGERVSLLVLIDTTLPERQWPAAAWTEYLGRRARYHLRRLGGSSARQTCSELGRLLRALARRIGKIAETSEIQDPLHESGLPEAIVTLRRGTLDAMAHYGPRPTRLPITLLRADRSDSTQCDPAIVWRRLTPSLTLRDVPGGHMQMIRGDNLAVLSSHLSQALRSAEDWSG